MGIMSMKTMAVLAGGLLLIIAFYVNAQKADNVVSPSDSYKMIQSDSSIVVLDVRTPAEFNSETGHLAQAILLPVQELERRIDELQKYKSNTILVYCRTGHRSTTASEILQKNGYNVRNMEGGITRWRAEQLPVVKERH
jgi:rhodanese-related sulfurtransferase